MDQRKNSPIVKVFDFFSGCGGTSYGFQKAGMEITYALDHDKDSSLSFKANFPNSHFEFVDIREVDIKSLLGKVKSEYPNPVLFSGCAPCQPFTKQNTTRPKIDQDERVPLITYFLKIIEQSKPDLVFLENVPGLQKLDAESEPFGEFLKTLNQEGYELDFCPIKLANYGIPQSRRRLVLVASRHGSIKLPKETHGPGTANSNYSTVRDWIAHFPKIKAGEEHKKIPNHKAAKLSELNLKRIKATPEGGGNRDWPISLQLNCHKGFSGFTDVYGRMWWDKPSSGLTTRCISYSNGRFGHPEQNRAISIREAASLQTFPENYIFRGNMNSIARQIGNAVPVRLAELVGKCFINHLKERERLT